MRSPVICLHLSLISHLSNLISSHSQPEMLCSSKRGPSVVLPYLPFCIWLIDHLRLHPLPELPFIFPPAPANSSLPFKSQLSCHTSRKPFLPLPQYPYWAPYFFSAVMLYAWHHHWSDSISLYMCKGLFPPLAGMRVGEHLTHLLTLVS